MMTSGNPHCAVLIYMSMIFASTKTQSAKSPNRRKPPFQILDQRTHILQPDMQS
jgi:hypothetical protein